MSPFQQTSTIFSQLRTSCHKADLKGDATQYHSKLEILVYPVYFILCLSKAWNINICRSFGNLLQAPVTAVGGILFQGNMKIIWIKILLCFIYWFISLLIYFFFIVLYFLHFIAKKCHTSFIYMNTSLEYLQRIFYIQIMNIYFHFFGQSVPRLMGQLLRTE